MTRIVQHSQMELGELNIGAIKISPKSRDDIPKLLKGLEEQNIYSVGRYGEWKYSSMQEAVLDGKRVVEKVTIMPAKQAYETPNLVIPPNKQKEL